MGAMAMITDRGGKQRRWLATIALLAHAGLVLVGLGYYLLSVYAYSTPDANIGAGLGLLWLAFFGFPWSIPIFGNDIDGQAVWLVACAVANVVAHAWLTRPWRR